MLDFSVSSYSELEELLTPEDLYSVSQELSKAKYENRMVHIRVECDSFDEDYYYLKDVYTMTTNEYYDYLNKGGTWIYHFPEEILDA